MSKKQTKTTITTTTISREWFADKFMDRREHAAINIDLQNSMKEVQSLSTTLIQLNSRLVVQNDLNADVAEHKCLLNDSEDARGALQKEIRCLCDKHAQLSAQYQKTQDELIAQIDDRDMKIQRMHREAEAARKAHLQEKEQMNLAFEASKRNWSAELSSIKCNWTDEVAALNAKHSKTIADMIALHESQINEVLRQHEATKRNWSDDVIAINANHSKKTTELNSLHTLRIDDMLKQLSDLRIMEDAEIRRLEQKMTEERQVRDTKINEQTLVIERQRKDIDTRDGIISNLQARIAVFVDIEAQLSSSKSHCSQMFEAKKVLQQELTTAAEYITELETKFLKVQEVQIELLKALKDTEFDLEAALMEIQTLKQYIIDLKARIAVYIPVKNDTVDRKLAEYINNFPDRQKLKIMFMRESDGVYQFGTKKVHVRVDKDKINVRVGGGYLSIDEFLDQYTPQELEKLERKDPLKRFNEKVAIQKVLVGKEARESSPIRSSPTRVSKSRAGASPTKRI